MAPGKAPAAWAVSTRTRVRVRSVDLSEKEDPRRFYAKNFCRGDSRRTEVSNVDGSDGVADLVCRVERHLRGFAVSWRTKR